ncbi:MAG: hypothetical protein JNM84_25215 [Planctomycetes bacterium]|nr:hypothetical protein [Planctomycetota bacterium]
MFPRSLLALALLSAPAFAQTVVAPFNTSYSFVDLGTPANVTPNFGGCTFRVGDPGTLYLCGGANTASGAVYRVPVVRDAQGHVTGFGGAGVVHATAPNNDGGLEFGPGGVLFYSRYPSHEVGMIRPGSTTTDKVVSVGLSGFNGSLGALRFVPAGLPNVGALKLASYNSGQFATATLAPDGNGTFDITSVTVGTQPGFGPEGFFYVPPDSPLFVNFRSMLVCEYGAGEVAVYDIDANGDPIPATRRVFITGLSGIEGAALDPISGDFFFSTYGGGNRVIAVRGFGLPCGAVVPYGNGLGGTGGVVPRLDAVGCFARRQTVSFVTSQGLPGAPGIFLAGVQPSAVPIFGGQILVLPLVQIAHVLDAGGASNLPIPIPDDTNLLNTDFFTQVLYIDAGAPQLVSFSTGQSMRVR